MGVRWFVVLALVGAVTVTDAHAECPPAALDCVLPVTGDALGGGHRSEQDTNFGDRPRLRLKADQGVGLLQFDLASALADRTVLSATLHLTPVVDVGVDRVSTIATPWLEAEATYLERRSGQPWKGRAGTILEVVNGRGGSLENSRPNVTDPVWQLAAEVESGLAIDPQLIVAIQQGRAHGLALYSNRVRDNHDIYSREQNGRGPRLSVTLAERDETPPARPIIGLPTGELDPDLDTVLTFELGPGSADTVALRWAFGTQAEGTLSEAQPAPFGLRVVATKEHAERTLFVWALDAAGNVSQPAARSLSRYGLDRSPTIVDALLRQSEASVDVSICLADDLLEGFGLFVTASEGDEEIVRRALYGHIPAGPRRSSSCAGPLHLTRLPAAAVDVSVYLAPVRQGDPEPLAEPLRPDRVETRFDGVAVLSDSANIELVSGAVVGAATTRLNPGINRWFDPVRGMLGAEVQPGGTAVWQLITDAGEGQVHAPVWEAEAGAEGLELTVSRVDPVWFEEKAYADVVRPVTGPAYVVPQDPSLLPVQAGPLRTVILVELRVPKTIVGPVGLSGTLNWQVGDQTHRFDTTVRVAGSALPDRLTWDTSLNTYGGLDSLFGLDTRVPGECVDCPEFLAVETAVQRLAHAHRSTLAQVPYGHGGGMIDEHADGVSTTPFAPPLNTDGSVADWSGWDAHFGAWLDGSAFADLPRSGVPVGHLFLPFNWNWPGPWPSAQRQRPDCHERTPAEPLINTPIDCGGDDENCLYVKRSRRALADFSSHIAAADWPATDFQYFFNTKRSFESVCQNLDEPTEASDYATLRFLGGLLRSERGPDSPIGMRVDIGHPEYLAHAPQELDEVLDLAVMGRGLFDQRVSDRLAQRGVRRWTYGAAVGVNRSLAEQVGEAWRAAARGLNGMVFWNVAGGASDPLVDLDGGDGSLLLFYPSQPLGPQTSGVLPLASMRLKATRRMAEDFHLLAQRPEFVRMAISMVESGSWADPRALSESRRIMFRRLDVGDPPPPGEDPPPPGEDPPLPGLTDDLPDGGCGCSSGTPAAFWAFACLILGVRRRTS